MAVIGQMFYGYGIIIIFHIFASATPNSRTIAVVDQMFYGYGKDMLVRIIAYNSKNYETSKLKN